jgi:hypothetical protein
MLLLSDIYRKFDRYTQTKIRPTTIIPYKGELDLYHIVYCWICLLDGRFYIGKHSSYIIDDQGLDPWYDSSSPHLYNAINKYGINNFYHFPICYCSTSDIAYFVEHLLITEEMVLSKDCFNHQGGGKGFACGKLNPNHERLLNGTHSLLSKNHWCYKAFEDGTHPWSNHENHPSVIRSKNGTHHFIGLKSWLNPHSTELSKLTWWFADKIYELHLKFLDYGHARLTYITEINLSIEISGKTLRNMLDRFREGWIPIEDPEWLKFKLEFKVAS